MINSIGPIISDSCGTGSGVSIEEPLAGTVFSRVELLVGVNMELSGGSVEAFAGGLVADIVTDG